MNTITINPAAQPLTMSSREIAELTGKEHKHVMRDIRVMLDELQIDRSKFGRVYTDSKGEQRPCYHLPKNLTITLVSGYSVVLRSRIVDRWIELEDAAQPAPVLARAGTKKFIGEAGSVRFAQVNLYVGYLVMKMVSQRNVNVKIRIWRKPHHKTKLITTTFRY